MNHITHMGLISWLESQPLRWAAVTWTGPNNGYVMHKH